MTREEFLEKATPGLGMKTATMLAQEAEWFGRGYEWYLQHVYPSTRKMIRVCESENRKRFEGDERPEAEGRRP